MSVGHREESRAGGLSADRGALTLSGALLLVGFVVNAIQRRIWHPTGAEDEHESIFTEYAASNAWVATHFAEFVLVLVALAGLLVLCGALRAETSYLALLAAGTIIATGAIWAVLQAVDGVTLKQTVDAWAAASGTAKATRLADAETARWIEWGLQSLFRVLLGGCSCCQPPRPERARRAPGGRRRPALGRPGFLGRRSRSGPPAHRWLAAIFRRYGVAC
jgi:hypothetical protein